MNWAILALISLFAFGIQNFLYKVSAEKKCNSAWTTFSFMATVAILSGILFFVRGESVDNLYFLLVLCLINAIAFFSTTITRIESLKHIAVSVALPIIRTALAIVVLVGIFYFNETPTFLQWLGILLAFLVIWVLAKQENKKKVFEKNFKLGIILAIIAMITVAASSVIAKIASTSVNKLAFIAVAYAYNVVFSLGIQKRLQTQKENPVHTNALIIGFFIGVLNFIAFYTVLNAYAIGPLSLVQPMISLGFIIPILLSIIIYKEKLTSRRIAGIALAIGAVILLSM